MIIFSGTIAPFNCEHCGKVITISGDITVPLSGTLSVTCEACGEVHFIEQVISIWTRREVASNRQALLDAIEDEKLNAMLDAEINADPENKVDQSGQTDTKPADGLPGHQAVS